MKQRWYILGKFSWKELTYRRAEERLLRLSLAGAPFIDAEKFAEELNSRELPGVYFRPLRFIPTFDKWAGQRCSGVYIHVLDPIRFRSYLTTVEILRAARTLCPSEFRWLPPPYEYELVKPPIDILSGSQRLRLAIDSRDDALLKDCVAVDETTWVASTSSHRLYSTK